MLSTELRLKMEDSICLKLEEFKKYLPFIDYLLAIDNVKYKKFVDIKQWITEKKRYPIAVLEKVEQSIITQYKNLFLDDDVKIPKMIMDIFNNTGSGMRCYSVNLCSDEEDNSSDGDIEIVSACLPKNGKVGLDTTTTSSLINLDCTAFISKGSQKYFPLNKEDEETTLLLERMDKLCNKLDKEDDNSDGDIEIVSTSLPKNNKIGGDSTTSPIINLDCTASTSKGIQKDHSSNIEDEETTLLLDRLDRLCKTPDKSDEKSNSCSNKDEFNIYGINNCEVKEEKQLFKRREDFVKIEKTKKKKNKSKKKKKRKKSEKEGHRNIKTKPKHRDNVSCSEPFYIDSTTDEECASKNPVDIDSGLMAGTPSVLNKEHVASPLQNNVTNEIVEPECSFLMDSHLEKLDIENLTDIFRNLSQLDKIDVERLLTVLDESQKTEVQNIENGSSTDSVPSNNNAQVNSNQMQYSGMQQEFPLNVATHNTIQVPMYQPTLMCQPTSHHINFQNFRKINRNDPRIIREFQKIQNSPLYSGITRATVANWTNSTQYSAIQNNQLHNVHQVNSVVQQSNPYQPPHFVNVQASSTKANTTYGEYKRKKAEQIIEAKRKKEKAEQEKAAKEKAEKEKAKKEKAEKEKAEKEMAEKEMAEKEKAEKEKAEKEMAEKKKAEIEKAEKEKAEKEKADREANEPRQQLMATLQPYDNQIQDMLRKQNGNTVDKSQEEHKLANDVVLQKKQDSKVIRVLKNLECTVEGYNQLCDYIPKSIGGKRRSSISARSAIAEQLNDRYSLNSEEDEEYQQVAQEIEPSLSLPKSNDSTFQMATSAPVVKRRKSVAENKMDNIIKRRKTTDTNSETLPFVPSPIISNIEDNSSDTDTYDFEKFQIEKAKSLALKNQPIVLLHQLTPAEIAKHMPEPTRRSSKVELKQKSLNVELVENISKTNLKSKNPPNNGASTKSNVKKRPNIDCLMTEHTTIFCVLCKSKPSDLTNHYIRSHKSESYVSRLKWEELDDLQLNTPFAVPLPNSGKSKTVRYKIKCPFCSDELIDYFQNFHAHYSTHTGEYAFQCGNCQLQKPFRADIQSHQLHSKYCRNARRTTLYQYPPNLMVIYLHCCKICNFVQLNEANIYKHLRDHHGKSSDDPKLVQKYILAAINDDEAITDRSSTETTSLGVFPDDDGITVSNEPICEDDSFVETKPQVEAAMEHLFNGPQEYNVTETTLEHCNKVVPESKSVPNSSIVYIPSVTIINTKLPTKCVPPQQQQMEASTESVPLLHRPMWLPPDDDIKPDIVKLEADMNLKNSTQEDNNSDTSTPPRPSSALKAIGEVVAVQPKYIQPHSKYRSYSIDEPFFGLHKCMATDCLFSTDSDDEMLKHLNDHTYSEFPPTGFLACAYCQFGSQVEECESSEILVAHVRKKHNRSRFQCSRCCYRSCLPGNVVIHEQNSHPAEKLDNVVYDCEGSEVCENQRLPQMMKAMSENVKKLGCLYCPSAFYSNSFMENHIKNFHKIPLTLTALKQYACIYCPKSLDVKREMQEHLALEHPDEFAFVCERILKPGLEMDSLHNLTLSNISSSEAPLKIQKPPSKAARSTSSMSPAMYGSVNIRKSSDANSEFLQNDIFEQDTQPPSANSNNCNLTDNVCDLKPSTDQLIKINEDAVKPLLLKLTLNTGVPPDRLYHCPIASCGGFFSIYELWARHMNMRHNCLIAACPHCPVKDDIAVELSLKEFKQHFKNHSRKLFLCFHCVETFVDEQQLHQHAGTLHTEMPDVRIETIPCNITYSYHVLINKHLHMDRLEFLLHLRDVLIMYLKDEADRKTMSKWLVLPSAEWLDDFPRYEPFSPRDKNCMYANCLFRTSCDDNLFVHMRGNHFITGQNFTYICKKCNTQIKNCHNWDVIEHHVKLHSSNIYICCGCSSFSHWDRNILSQHIKNLHNERDVPVLSLIRLYGCTHVAISVVFAANCKTFSTWRICLFCKKALTASSTLHLKSAHNLILGYFCELCGEALPQLQLCESHFRSKHSIEDLKIRCEFASSSQVTIESIVPLSVRVESIRHQKDISVTNSSTSQTPAAISEKQAQNPLMETFIKTEINENDSDDSDVVLVEEDDLIVNEKSNACGIELKSNEAPKIKCISIHSLLNTPTSTPLLNYLLNKPSSLPSFGQHSQINSTSTCMPNANTFQQTHHQRPQVIPPTGLLNQPPLYHQQLPSPINTIRFQQKIMPITSSQLNTRIPLQLDPQLTEQLQQQLRAAQAPNIATTSSRAASSNSINPPNNCINQPIQIGPQLSANIQSEQPRTFTITRINNSPQNQPIPSQPSSTRPIPHYTINDSPQ